MHKRVRVGGFLLAPGGPGCKSAGSCQLYQRWALDSTWVGLDPDYSKFYWARIGSGLL